MTPSDQQVAALVSRVQRLEILVRQLQEKVKVLEGGP